jgi:hypothetical protein
VWEEHHGGGSMRQIHGRQEAEQGRNWEPGITFKITLPVTYFLKLNIPYILKLLPTPKIAPPAEDQVSNI